VAAGVLCASLVDGVGGQVLGGVIMVLGVAEATLLCFFEVGLYGESARAEAKERARAATPPRPLEDEDDWHGEIGAGRRAEEAGVGARSGD
jgi:hypothetical protein